MDTERLEHMQGIFQGPLLKFRETLLMMASLTDRNFTASMNSLLDRNVEKANLVESEDSVIDKLEKEIDEMVITHLSTHGAMATACRLVLMASKISESLENIADQAVNISRRSRKLCELPEVQLDLDITEMARLALSMMRESIDAFVNVDPEKALPIIQKDKMLDAMNSRNEERINQAMGQNPTIISQCIHYMLISRGLERVGDYSKNIAQDVYYLYTAKDIRHGDG